MSSFMEIALQEAHAAGLRGEVPVGCAVVRGAVVIARAGNRTLTERDPTAHAEIVAIRQAASALGSERLEDCDLYVTLEPCAMCAGAVDNGVRFFASPTCHHRPEVYGGLAEAEAAALLREFFKARR